jgi:8-oxo-dGTP pyrophosphatase MutT (NUDIX family)
MIPWPPPCYRRAVAYVTDPAGRLLVFDHLDAPDAGTQVPAGGIHPGEAPEAAAVRELVEESGIADAQLVRKLGEAWHRADAGYVPAGLEEQVHHAFHLRLSGPAAAEAWEWDECSGGDVVQHRFALRWVDLDRAAGLLWPSQSLWLDPLRCSLRVGD